MTIRIPFPWEGNPLYPLPADYDALTVAGRRQARVAASRQWLIPASDMPAHPDLPPSALVGDAAAASHHFFDHYYLHPDPADGFDPYFYDMPPLPSADFHFDLVRMWAMYRQCLAIAPRGAAKTTVGLIDIIKRMATCPAYSMVYCTLVHNNAMLRSEKVREQCYSNSRLNDDFSPEYGGPLRPAKHEASTGVERFFLRNRSWLQPISSEGRQRGMRPRRYRLDDPEHDERVSTSMINVREYMDRLINRVVLPMVMQHGRGFDWTATHVSKRHYSWHAMSMIDTPDGPVSRDPRFATWARYHIQQLRTNPVTGAPESCWPHNWPVDEAEKKRLNLSDDTPTIADIRRSMGERAWLAEAQGQPGDSEERCFPLLAENEDAYFFDAVEPDESLEANPGGSASSIRFRIKKGDALEWVTIPLRDLLRRGNLFACSDYSYTSNSASDYKTCVVLLHDPITNVLFVLDGWAAQCGKDKAIRECFTLSSRWRTPSLYIEAVKGSITFYNEMVDIVRTKGPEHLGLSFLPAVRPLKVGMEPKEQKIESLSFRFEHHLIKFPRWKKHKAFFEMLFAQIEGFNPEAQSGGLEHDDCLDTVAMSKFVLKGRRRDKILTTPQSAKPPIQRLLEGEIHADSAHTNRPLGLAVDILNTPAALTLALIDSRESERPDGTRI